MVQEGGPLCNCGNRGCIEAIAGLEGLRRRVRELNAGGVFASLVAESFSFELLAAAVQCNDKAAVGLAMEVCHSVGVGLAAVVSILNPGIVVFSGGLARLGDRLLNTVRGELVLRCQPQAVQELTLRLSTLPEHGPALAMRDRALLQAAATA